jgi:hypothetical protein
LNFFASIFDSNSGTDLSTTGADVIGGLVGISFLVLQAVVAIKKKAKVVYATIL